MNIHYSFDINGQTMYVVPVTVGAQQQSSQRLDAEADKAYLLDIRDYRILCYGMKNITLN